MREVLNDVRVHVARGPWAWLSGQYRCGLHFGSDSVRCGGRLTKSELRQMEAASALHPVCYARADGTAYWRLADTWLRENEELNADSVFVHISDLPE